MFDVYVSTRDMWFGLDGMRTEAEKGEFIGSGTLFLHRTDQLNEDIPEGTTWMEFTTLEGGNIGFMMSLHNIPDVYSPVKDPETRGRVYADWLAAEALLETRQGFYRRNRMMADREDLVGEGISTIRLVAGAVGFPPLSRHAPDG